MSAKVQATVLNSIGTGATTIPLPAFGSAVAVGDTIIAAFSHDWGGSTAVINSVTDGLGNVYTQLANSPINDAPSQQVLGIWRAPVTTAGTSTPVANLNVSAAFRSGLAVELSGVGAVDLVGTATNHGSSTTGTNGMSDGSLTPSVAGATVIGVGESHPGATMTAGTGWTQDATSGTAGASISLERLDQGAASSVTAQWTIGVADFFNALIFSLLPSGPPGVISQPYSSAMQAMSPSRLYL
jgi:hypothetical protein